MVVARFSEEAASHGLVNMLEDCMANGGAATSLFWDMSVILLQTQAHTLECNTILKNCESWGNCESAHCESANLSVLRSLLI